MGKLYLLPYHVHRRDFNGKHSKQSCFGPGHMSVFNSSRIRFAVKIKYKGSYVDMFYCDRQDRICNIGFTINKGY